MLRYSSWIRLKFGYVVGMGKGILKYKVVYRAVVPS